jgi:hypothetical protein
MGLCSGKATSQEGGVGAAEMLGGTGITLDNGMVKITQV